MSRFVSLLLVVMGVVAVHGMDCTFGTSDNALDKFIHTCPRPLLDSSDESYCCVNLDQKVYCCDLFTFITTSLTILLPILIGIFLLSIIVSCLCCFCCPCCFVYKRRNAGR